jgi:integrase
MAKPIKVGDKWRVQFRRKGQSSISRYFDKKTHAEAYSRQVDHDLRAGEFSSSREFINTTVEDILIRYETEISKVKEMGRSKKHCLKTLRIHFGSTFINKLDSETIIAYANKRQSMGAGGVTVNMELTYLKGVLQIAKLIWKIPIKSDPVADARSALKHLGLITKSNKRDRRPTKLEIDQLIAYYAKKARQLLPMGDIIQFAIASAMRAGEIGSLRWDDLNESDKTILIRDRKDPQEKIGNNQTVPLLKIGELDAFEIIKRQPKTSELIFPWKFDTVSSIFPRACRALEIVDLHFHDLRHEGVSRLFEAGYQIQEVAIVSGHKDWAQLKRYTQLKAKNLHRINT